MNRVYRLAVLGVVVGLTKLYAQTAAPETSQKPVTAGTQGAAGGDVSIEVSVVRPHPEDVHHNDFSFGSHRFVLEDQPVFKLISYAYSLNQRQIVGAPTWVIDRHYDMTGTTNLAGDATVPQQQALLRQLLETRFGLRMHREQREMPVYAIQLVKGGSRLTSAADPNVPSSEQDDGHGTQTTRSYTSTSIAEFLVRMQLFLDRPLVDQTGLAGRYDFNLTYSYRAAQSQDPDAPPPLFTAIQEQLGLKFQPVKAPVAVMVIDRIEEPTAN